MKESESESRSVVSDSLWPHGLYRVHGILQARILEWVAFPFSRGSPQPRAQKRSYTAGGFFTSWAKLMNQIEFFDGSSLNINSLEINVYLWFWLNYVRAWLFKIYGPKYWSCITSDWNILFIFFPHNITKLEHQFCCRKID